MWDLAFKTWADAKSVKSLAAGTIVEVSALAEHPLGGKYYLSEYSYSRGVGNGINVKDCEDYVDPVAPPKDTSVVQPPADAPINEAPVINPVPTPVPIPVPTVEERLTKIEAFIAALKEFFSKINWKFWEK